MKNFFSDNDHKLYLMDQKNTLLDHFFPEEALSEEQLIRKSGKNKKRRKNLMMRDLEFTGIDSLP